MADIRKCKLSYESWMGSNLVDFCDLNPHNSLILSLPIANDNLKTLLTSLSTRLTNRCLVTRIIQPLPDPRKPGSNTSTSWYSIAKPFVWHRNESIGSALDEQLEEIKGDQWEWVIYMRQCCEIPFSLLVILCPVVHLSLLCILLYVISKYGSL